MENMEDFTPSSEDEVIDVGMETEEITPELLDEILDPKNPILEKRDRCLRRRKVQERLLKHHAGIHGLNKDLKMKVIKQRDEYTQEFAQESLKNDKLKALVEQLEQKLSQFEADPSSDPLIQREEAVQELVKRREEEESPDEQRLLEELDQLKGQVEGLRADLDQAHTSIQDTRAKISKFHAPCVESDYCDYDSD